MTPGSTRNARPQTGDVRGIVTSVIFILGLVMVFVGERVIGEGAAQKFFAHGGAGLATLATAARAFIGSQKSGPAQKIERVVLGAHVGALLALVLYAFSTDAGFALLGSDNERLRPMLSVLWPAVLAVALATLLFTETAWQRMLHTDAADQRRIRNAASSGASLALAAVFCVSLNFAAHQRDAKRDLSYFKTTEPSEGTQQMVAALGEPVEVVLVYPEVNEVKSQLLPYFQEIAAASDQLTLTERDHALSPTLAQQHRIRGNGFIVLLKGEGESQQAESMEIGMELAAARSRLRTLDGRFRESFTRLTKVRREIHLTTGHRERSASGDTGDDRELRLSDFMTALRRSNITTRPLGMAHGLANRVPEGAPAVAVIGPRDALLPEECAALVEYVKSGGRLFVLLDPDEDHGLGPLLDALGLVLLEGQLASERSHLRRTHTQADRQLVFTNRYSAHPTVTTANSNHSRLATVVVGGGALKRRPTGAPEGVNIDFPIRTGRDVWRDLDGDFARGDDEPYEEAYLMAAVTVRNESGDEGRAAIISDADFVSDQVLGNPGNGYVAADVFQWLLGEEQIVSDETSEQDIRIEHTRDEDKLWFYGTSFGAPLPILAMGFFVAARRGKRAGVKRDRQAPSEPPAPTGESLSSETARRREEEE